MPDPFEELDKILDAGAAADEERERLEAADAAARHAWVEEFGQWINSVVAPTLAPLAQHLRGRGIEATFLADGKSGHQEAAPMHDFALRLGPEFGATSAKITIIREPDRIVTIERSAGEGRVVKQSKRVDQVTTEMLEQTTVEAVRDRFGS